jgi:hypothetical protein
MSKLIHIGEIETIVYNQLEASKKLFQVILALIKVARHVDEHHQLALEKITEDLIDIGNTLSDDAQATGAKLLQALTEEPEPEEPEEPTQDTLR